MEKRWHSRLRGPAGGCVVSGVRTAKGVDMAKVPEIFRATAAWAEGRPFGDAAGMAVFAVLGELTGPPRIGVCTVDAPVNVTIAGAVMVHTAWPAVGSGTDVVLLIHPGTVPGRVRSRMQVGPQKFVCIKDKEQAENYSVAISELAAIRERLLICELRALAPRFPEVNDLIPELPVEQQQQQPRVVIISPDPEQVATLCVELEPHFTVVNSADADVVVAAPGKCGFTLADAPTIQDAWQRVGRLVTLSPLPEGMCPGAVPAGRNLVATINRLASAPAKFSIPAVPGARWRQVMERMDIRRREEIQQLRRAGDRAGMRVVAREQGIDLPPDPTCPVRDLIIVAGIILGICFFRLEMLPVAVGVAGMRMMQQYRRAVNLWWEDAQAAMHLDITTPGGRGGYGPREWLHTMFHQHERTG